MLWESWTYGVFKRSRDVNPLGPIYHSRTARVIVFWVSW